MGSVRQEIAEAGDITSENPLSTRNLDGETSKPKLTTQLVASSINPPNVEKRIQRKAAPTKETVHLDICLPFIRTKLIDNTVPIPSSFTPSAHMMYYVLHCLDDELSRNHHFVQNNTNWNPLISRIYYGILFHIQTLRCMQHVNKLNRKALDFLRTFLEAYPPECLSIAGPLVPIFQALTVSKSRFTYQGKIYPSILTENIVENLQLYRQITRKNAQNVDQFEDVPDGNSVRYDEATMFLPNMYGLFGCLDTITSPQWKTLVGSRDYPRSFDPFFGLQPVAAQGNRRARPFNGINVNPSLEDGTDNLRLIFASPGLSYPLETGKDQNEKFTDIGDRLQIPPYRTTLGRFDIVDFLNLDDLSWFSRVMSMMTSHSKYFKQPSTLDKCSVEGPACNQIIVSYERQRRQAVKPKFFGDPASQLQLAFKAYSCNPEITDTEQIMAFFAQVNVCLPDNYLLGSNYTWRTNRPLANKEGPFWNIRPICMETGIDNGYLQIPDIVKDHFYLDKPKF